MAIVWTFFGIGVVFCIGTAAWIRYCTIEDDFEIPQRWKCIEWFGENRDDIADRTEAIWWYTKMILQHMLVAFCIATAVSILAVWWMVFLYTLMGSLTTWFEFVFLFVIPIIFIYAGAHQLFKLSNFPDLYSHIIFIMTYIIAIFYWSSMVS